MYLLFSSCYQAALITSNQPQRQWKLAKLAMVKTRILNRLSKLLSGKKINQNN